MIAKLIQIVTIFALLIFSSHAMAREGQKPRHCSNHIEMSDHKGEPKSCSKTMAMPICLICLAAGTLNPRFAQITLRSEAIDQPLPTRLNGKSLRPPVPPPRLIL